MIRACSLALVLVASMAVPGPVAAGFGAGFHLEPVAGGFARPVYVTGTPANPNRLYVVEQRGVIKVLRRDSTSDPWVSGGVFLDLRSRVTKPGGGRGMMGLTFHPNYAKNGRFYVHYTRRSPNAGDVGDIVIAEYKRRDSLRAYTTGRTVLVIDHPTKYHTGGWMGFGRDGYMYVSIGDAAQTELNNGQNLENLQGKILRFNPRKADGVDGFIPPDNPFVGNAGNDLIWAYGLRHPWRASFDRATGDIWIGDAGQNKWEEVTRFSPATTGNGANLGWTMCEGSHSHPPAEPAAQCTAPNTVGPTIEYGHENGRCSVIGGYVYRGAASPDLAGRYFFGDYCTGEIFGVPANYDLGEDMGTPLDTDLFIRSFGEDTAGEIYVLANGGTLWRVAQD
jgi:glucose/arabinose dehydrogenase